MKLLGKDMTFNFMVKSYNLTALILHRRLYHGILQRFNQGLHPRARWRRYPEIAYLIQISKPTTMLIGLFHATGPFLYPLKILR